MLLGDNGKSVTQSQPWENKTTLEITETVINQEKIILFTKQNKIP